MKFSFIGKIKKLFCKLSCCNSKCFNNSVNIILDDEIELHIERKILEHFDKHFERIGFKITGV